MKKLILTSLAIIFGLQLIAQSTTIVNYNFNGAGSFPLAANATATNISCSATGSDAFQTFTGAATGSMAFTQNTNAGDALAFANSYGSGHYFIFHISGSALTSYQGFRMYFQSQRSSTGATTITVATSTNGSTYTDLSPALTVPASFGENVVDLSSLTGAADIYIKLTASGATQNGGTLRLDNFEIQGSATAWQTSGGNVNFSGRIGVGNSSPQYPLDVTGTARVTGDQIVGGKVTSAGGFLFDNNNGLIFTPASGSNKQTFTLGGGSLQRIGTCLTPDQNAALLLQGSYVSRAISGSVNSSLTMFSTPWDGNGVLEVEGLDNTGNTNNALMLNYFCGRNTLINTNNGLNNRGGKVIMGEQVSMAKNVKIGYDGTSNIDPNTSLAIWQAGPNQKALVFNTWDNSVPLISVVNTNFASSPFTVLGNGDFSNKGTIITGSLAGQGSRTVLVDNAGKLILGTPTTANTTNWVLGGNDFSNNGVAPNIAGSLGTLNNDNLNIVTNNAARMQITNTGNFIFGYNPGYAPSRFSFNEYGAPTAVSIDAADASLANIYRSSLFIRNNGGDIELALDEFGIGRLMSNTSHVMSFKGETILIGEPDPTDQASYGELDINTKLTITTKTTNAPDPLHPYNPQGYTSNPLKIININENGPTKTIFEILEKGQTNIKIINSSTQADAFTITDGTSNKINFKVKANGYAYAREINVMPDNLTFPDYVFASDYKLSSLSEVEKYVKANKHLPGIPSAKEVEANGINLSELMVHQMEKIENLYLYIIELKKENEDLKSKINAIAKSIK